MMICVILLCVTIGGMWWLYLHYNLKRQRWIWLTKGDPNHINKDKVEQNWDLQQLSADRHILWWIAENLDQEDYLLYEALEAAIIIHRRDRRQRIDVPHLQRTTIAYSKEGPE